MIYIHNCSECDYCYTNDTMDGMSICVNGKSEMLGQVVDSYGMAEDDMDCVVIDGKDRDEIDMDDADAHWEAMDDIEREEWMRGAEDEI